MIQENPEQHVHFKTSKRSLRRHHYRRLKKNRSHYWGYGKYGQRSYGWDEIVEMQPDMLGSVARTPTPCSCYMCGNPRRSGMWSGDTITIQERKEEENYKYNLLEVEEEII